MDSSTLLNSNSTHPNNSHLSNSLNNSHLNKANPHNSHLNSSPNNSHLSKVSDSKEDTAWMKTQAWVWEWMEGWTTILMAKGIDEQKVKTWFS